MNRSMDEHDVARLMNDLANAAEISHPDAPPEISHRPNRKPDANRRPRYLTAVGVFAIVVAIAAALVARHDTSRVSTAVPTSAATTARSTTVPETTAAPAPAYNNDTVGFSMSTLPTGMVAFQAPVLNGNPSQSHAYQAFAPPGAEAPPLIVAVTRGVPATDVINANNHPDTPLEPSVRQVGDMATYIGAVAPMGDRQLVWIVDPTTVAWLTSQQLTDDQLFDIAATLTVRR